MQSNLSLQEIYSIVYQEHRDPFQVLGPHISEIEGKRNVAVRSYLPAAKEAYIVASDTQKEYPMQMLHHSGFYEALCADREEVFPYQIKITKTDGTTTCFHDSYSFLPGLTNFDLYLIQQGCHYKTFEKLGAHIVEMNGVQGVYFAVWAPNAKSVSVIGSFNAWDRRYHAMRTLGASGVWEIFIPGIGQGEGYKYQITTYDNLTFDKTDPHGFYCETSPRTASIVYDLNQFRWNDELWLEKRAEKQKKSAPISIYELHIGSWVRDPKNPKRMLSYAEVAHRLVDYVKDMGYTHVELLPVMEHPFYGSWGYQCLGLYAPSSRYGTPDEFRYMIDLLHQNDIGVLLDWVPAHFPTDAHGLAYFDATYLYEHADPRKREHKDWNTYIYNYGRYEVKNFLISNALFWLQKYHLDGLRVDAVASMLYLDYSKGPGEWSPNRFGGRENLEAISFLQECNDLVQKYHPGVLMIAEESTTWPKVSGPTYLGGLGFTHKWNMGWMNDILRYMSMDPIFRKYHHNILAFSIWYAFTENFVLPLSHDEVVHGKASLIGKMPGDLWQRFANLRLLFGYMFAHPGKKMLFMGNDFGQWNEWAHESSLDWHLLEDEPHKKLQNFVRSLNFFYQEHPALYENDSTSEGFEWCDYSDADHSVIAFWRKSEKEKLLFVFNFTPVPWNNYRLGVEDKGTYQEIFNTDSEWYWGSNVGNMGHINASENSWHDRPYTLSIQLPPLGMIVLKPLESEKKLVIQEDTEKSEKKQNELIKKEDMPKEVKKEDIEKKINPKG